MCRNSMGYPVSYTRNWVTMCPCKLRSPWCPLRCPGTPSSGSLEDSQAMVLPATTLISVLPREPRLLATGQAPLWELIPGVWPDALPASTGTLKAHMGVDTWVSHCALLTSCLSLAFDLPPLLLSGQCFLLMVLWAPVFSP